MALDLFSHFRSNSRLALLGAAFLLLALGITARAADFNSVVLAQVKAMPQGGSYAANRLATIRLQGATHIESGKFCLLPDSASPSFCSSPCRTSFLTMGLKVMISHTGTRDTPGLIEGSSFCAMIAFMLKTIELRTALCRPCG